jgi:hypothetical protein
MKAGQAALVTRWTWSPRSGRSARVRTFGMNWLREQKREASDILAIADGDP